jgi:hypothetical protein
MCIEKEPHILQQAAEFILIADRRIPGILVLVI